MALTQALVKDRVHYNPETGTLTWKIAPRYPSKAKVGDQVGYNHPNGYLAATVAGYKVLVHRLVWVLHYGQIPSGMEVDHRDGNKMNNRVDNLRLATRRQNQENFRKCRTDSTSGLQGVCRVTRPSGRVVWAARIMVNGRRRTLGYFETPDEAHAAYVKAKRELHEFCTI